MDEFAGIYGGLYRMGIGKPDADEMELWDVAVAFGMHLPDDGNTDAPAEPYAGYDPIAARVAAHNAGLPEPKAPPPSPRPRGARPTLRPVPDSKKRGA